MKRKIINFSLIMMILLSLVAQILSLLKSSIVVGTFGVGNEMDAYNLANNVVTFFFSFVASGISTIIIPEYANDRNKKAVNAFITVIYGSMLIFVVLMIVLRVQLFGIFGSRGESFTNLTANIFTVLLLGQYCSSIANITVAYFQCAGKYNVPKIISLFVQTCTIIVLLLFDIDIGWYTIIIAASLILNFMFDISMAVKLGWRYKPTLSFDKDTKTLLKRFLPVIVSTGVYQLTMLIDTTISTFLDEGKLSILSYSSQISSLVNSLLIGNLMIYIFPKITKRIHEAGYQEHFWESSVSVHTIVCLLSAGFLTVGHEGITLLFQRGAFTGEAATMVFIGTAIYIVGNQITIIHNFIYRYFYAVGDTKTPGINSVSISVFNIVISIVLAKLMGIYGIIVGTILVSFISLVTMLISFHKKIGFCSNFISVIGKYFVSFTVFLVTVGLVYLTKYLLPITNVFVSLIVYGLETIVVYVGTMLLLNKKVLLNLREL